MIQPLELDLTERIAGLPSDDFSAEIYKFDCKEARPAGVEMSIEGGDEDSGMAGLI